MQYTKLGGTEFPMMIMDGSASEGLIVHELGHNYVMGILANNEWREGWLDEGFTSYQKTLYGRANGEDFSQGAEAWLVGLDLDGMSEPASLVSDKYRDFTSYGISIYIRGEWFFHKLEYVVGPDAMRRILRTFYERWKLKHVGEAAFRAVAEEVSGMDLSTLFAQGLHGTELVDYAVGRVAGPGSLEMAINGVLLVRALLRIFDQAAQGQKDLITISRRDIANIVGTATESLNRTLSDFKDETLIIFSTTGSRSPTGRRSSGW